MMELSSIGETLAEQGLVKIHGFSRLKASLTDKGREVLRAAQNAA